MLRLALKRDENGPTRVVSWSRAINAPLDTKQRIINSKSVPDTRELKHRQESDQTSPVSRAPKERRGTINPSLQSS
jgi:hypothetical protein